VRIGPYEVLGELGRGGMGAVYRARDPGGHEVALKLLPQADPAAFARFDRERRLLASLGEAQGFVGLLDAGSSPTGAWLVMPLVSGGTLRDRLHAGPLGVEETLDIGIALARALGAAHERGVVHRDVKPENVLFDASADGSRGRPLLADLGLAKHFDRGAAGASQSLSQTGHGAFKGTAGYVAPEQLADARAAGPPADVFSLGAVLYECLAGRPVAQGDSIVEVLAKLGSGKFDPIGRASVPDWLERVVLRALARDPRARFADGASLAKALVAREGKAPPRRSLGPLVLGAAAGGIVLGGIVVALSRTGRAPEKAPRERASALASPPAPAASGLPAAALPAAALPAAELLDLALKKIASRDYEGAVADSARAIGLDPKLAGAWSSRGCARFHLGDAEGAIADCTRAIELDPVYVQAWANRAAARFQRGDLDGAAADSTRAIELDPSDSISWVNRGAARIRKRDLDGAIADCSRAIELDPARAVAWDTRGSARKEKNDLAGAIADVSRAIELDPQNAQFHGNRALSRSANGDLPGAIADATRAIELAPGIALTWRTRAGARLATHDLDGAIADATRAIELEPGDAMPFLVRAHARFGKGDYAGVMPDCTRVIELDPSQSAAWYGRGVCRVNTGDFAGAIPDLERFLELETTGADVGEARRLLAQARERAR
jgi:tetratricopeptide (TPR) repeat protein